MLLAAFLVTLGGHYFTEYTLQKTRLGILKRKSFWGLIIHTSLWTLAMCPGLWLLDLFAPWKALFLFATHTVIDAVKMSIVSSKKNYFHPTDRKSVV